MTRRNDLSDSSGVLSRKPAIGITIIEFAGTPTNGVKGFAPGCIWINVSATVAGTFVYINQGTNLSTTWLNIA